MPKTLPHSIEAESATLGSMILDPRAVTAVSRILTADDYYQPKHGIIHDAILALNATGNAVDMVKLVAYLEDKGQHARVGGTDYLIELFESVPTASGAESYANTVADRALRRRTIDALYHATEDAQKGENGGLKALDSAIGSLMALRPSTAAQSGPLGGFVGDSALPDPESLKTGIRPLDAILGGWEPGSFNVVAARPSNGKTALAIHLASHFGRQGVPCGFISAEMAGKKIGRRFVCQEAGLNMGRVRAGRISEDERRQAEAAQQRVRSWPIHLDETPGIAVPQVQAQVRHWKLEHDVKVVFVDYLQLLGRQGREEYTAVTEDTMALKHLGRELRVVMVVLAQLNRGVDQSSRPRSSHVKGSGQVEQDADSMTLLHKTADCTELIVAKNRDGETGTARVRFDGGTGRFEEMAAL